MNTLTLTRAASARSACHQTESLMLKDDTDGEDALTMDMNKEIAPTRLVIE
jgi:hypothetical protein